jgi:high-affinity iron transporter
MIDEDMKKSMTREKITNLLETKRVCCFAIIIIPILVLANTFVFQNPSNYSIYATSARAETSPAPTVAATTTTPSLTRLNDTELLIVLVNLERIQTQLQLTEKSLADGDETMAFVHAYIPHSVTFPTMKNQLNALNQSANLNLESMLTDLPIVVKSGIPKDKIRESMVKIEDVLNSLVRQVNNSNKNDKTSTTNNTELLSIQTIVYLLRDAAHAYQLSNISQQPQQPQQLQSVGNKVNYQNAMGLVQTAKGIFAENVSKTQDINNNRRTQEINSFFTELQKSISDKVDYQRVSHWIVAIERDLLESLSLNLGSHQQQNNQQAKYFETIRTLLRDLVLQVKNGNYQKADQNAVTAYLDNFEFLEAPLEKLDPKLMKSLELDMREHLRQIIKERQSSESIAIFVNSILVNLDKAEQLLRINSSPSSATQESMIGPSNAKGGEFANVQELSKGFGVYTGERRTIGQSDESSKGIVRSNIDKIRMKLDDMLQLYKKGNYNEALSASRSAYLDSYENVEVPLRPINPDFTLDMEIKFAQLRNLIQAKSSYEQVQHKVIEIREGLDESERLVSGTGVIAPTIAFSTSFSIVFREGLESALIVGAILTYLEASRNDRFKKHVYYGIIIAVAATAITWFIAEYIIEISGANRELIEAIAGISAVAVLFWVSFWVLNKVETKRWIEFVKAKVWQATTTGSVVVFLMLSFFTVYREGFETVLFYQAMLSFAKYMEWYVIAGLVSGLAIIVGIVFLIKKLGRKLPLRVLFGLTMGVGAYMSIAFMGNAIRSFQEIGYISTTHLIGIIPRLDINLAKMTGIHPTLESVVAQLILLAVYLVGSSYILIIQPRRKKAIQTGRKSMADLEKSKK